MSGQNPHQNLWEKSKNSKKKIIKKWIDVVNQVVGFFILLFTVVQKKIITNYNDSTVFKTISHFSASQYLLIDGQSE